MAVLAILVPNVIFGAFGVPRCSQEHLAVTLNKPVPESVFSSSEEVIFDGRIWYPGSIAGRGKCAKIAFFVTPDRDPELADCYGRPAGSCQSSPAVCAVPAVCGLVSAAEKFTITEDPNNTVFKIGELEIPDTVGAVNSGDYSVEFHQSFKLPEIFSWRGPVRFYVQYSGIAADASGKSALEWSMAYQKATIDDNLGKVAIPEAIAGASVQTDYCASASGPAAILYWKWLGVKSSKQVAYQIQISERSDFLRLVHDSGKILSGNTNYATPAGKFVWGTRYYWRVKAWDQAGAASNWSSGTPFDAPMHAYPKVSFVWTPKTPVAQDEVEFIDESEIYGKSSKVRWLWSFEGGTPAISYDQGTKTVFSTNGIKKIELSVTDSDGYTCAASHSLSVDQKP